LGLGLLLGIGIGLGLGLGVKVRVELGLPVERAKGVRGEGGGQRDAKARPEKTRQAAHHIVSETSSAVMQ
jgi:hypothetical protein